MCNNFGTHLEAGEFFKQSPPGIQSLYNQFQLHGLEPNQLKLLD